MITIDEVLITETKLDVKSGMVLVKGYNVMDAMSPDPESQTAVTHIDTSVHTLWHEDWGRPPAPGDCLKMTVEVIPYEDLHDPKYNYQHI